MNDSGQCCSCYEDSDAGDDNERALAVVDNGADEQSCQRGGHGEDECEYAGKARTVTLACQEDAGSTVESLGHDEATEG